MKRGRGRPKDSKNKVTDGERYWRAVEGVDSAQGNTLRKRRERAKAAGYITDEYCMDIHRLSARIALLEKMQADANAEAGKFMKQYRKEQREIWLARVDEVMALRKQRRTARKNKLSRF